MKKEMPIPKLSLFLSLFLVVALTIFSGAMQGQLANRWGPPEELRRAGEQLTKVPLRCGDWVAEKNETLSEAELQQLDPAGYLSRRYTNEKTGDVINVTVLAGHPGPIAVHTPEICFSSRKYRRETTRESVSVGEANGSDHLWTLTFRSRELDAHRLQSYYGWSTGSEWKAATDARYAFAGFPFLYKIQLAGVIGRGELADETASDPCRLFLKEFLPQLKEFQSDPTRDVEGS